MSTPEEAVEGARERLLAEIAAEYRDTARWTGRAEISPQVRAALLKVPREAFLDENRAGLAYANIPLPIGHGQTISQPYIVAIMTDLLDLTPDDAVLEVGTGCGYQAAVLGELAARVDTIEVVPELAERARQRLAALGYTNVAVHQGDGSKGWPEHAPYDGIIVTAAARRIPPALLAQLKPGGRMVLPVGEPWMTQELTLVTKDADGRVRERSLIPVAFVPLVEAEA